MVETILRFLVHEDINNHPKENQLDDLLEEPSVIQLHRWQPE